MLLVGGRLSGTLEYSLRILKELIAIPTVNPPGEHYEDAAGFLADELKSIGMSVRLIRIPEDWLDKHYPYAPLHRGYPRVIVYAWTEDVGEPTIHFNGHYDVVPPGTGWSFDPFKPIVRDGKVYGRGSNDMKAGIAATVAVLREALSRGLESRVRLEAAFVPDEESGGMGTKYLVEEFGVKPSNVVIAEPSGVSRVGIGHRGYVRGLIRVYGRQAHASLPVYGVNAFEKACQVLSILMSTYVKRLREVKSKYPFEPEEAASPTISFGGYAESTSKKDNIVPGEFVFSFDRRTIPEEDLEEVIRGLSQAVEQAASKADVKASIEVKAAIPGALTDPDSPLVRLAIDAAKRVGVEAKPFVAAGRTDQVYYTKSGSTVVTWGPGVWGTSHAVDEYVTIEEIRAILRGYMYMLEMADKYLPA